MPEDNGIRQQLEREWRDSVRSSIQNLDERIRTVELAVARLGGIGVVAKIIIPAIVSAVVAFLVKQLLG